MLCSLCHLRAPGAVSSWPHLAFHASEWPVPSPVGRQVLGAGSGMFTRLILGSQSLPAPPPALHFLDTSFPDSVPCLCLPQSVLTADGGLVSGCPGCCTLWAWFCIPVAGRQAGLQLTHHRADQGLSEQQKVLRFQLVMLAAALLTEVRTVR